jgi:hypothetical protein
VATFQFDQSEAAFYGAAASRHPLTTKGELSCHPYIEEYNPCFFSTIPSSDPYGIAVNRLGDVFFTDARDKKA